MSAGRAAGLETLPSRPPKLVITSLTVRDFRNLAKVEIVFSPRFNVISGQNGQGKTSLLEAIYFVATSKSFRTHRSAELVRHGQEAASVRAEFIEDPQDQGLAPLVREQHAAVAGARVVVKIDGARPSTLASFATRSPVITFHPDEMALSTGPAGLRRTLLDRLSLFMTPESADHRSRYDRAVKARQELLRRGSESESEIEAFEHLAAVHGSALTRIRAQATSALLPELALAFGRIAAPDLALVAEYAPGGTTDESEASAALRSSRRRDAGRPSPSFGPHRDDLVLSLDGRRARIVASQGQHRAITLALKAAEVSVIGHARGISPILLLDDVSSELDAERTDALFSYLASQQGQIFVTTTRRALISLPEGLASHERHFPVSGGQIPPTSE
ncbi:MAG: DNA replication and repair protein RecF [Polyangiaceae bacterium]|nr:DNA replication and repair protein RecF [Polyangiaceae bacterium]